MRETTLGAVKGFVNHFAIVAATSLGVLAGWAGEPIIAAPQILMVSTNTGAGSATNFFWVRPTGSNQPARPLLLPRTGPPRSAGQALPDPGVYTAEPYKLMVVVPGPQVDDKCLAGPSGQSQAHIRKVSPELRLVPREPAKR